MSSSGETGAQIKAQFIGESGSGAADRPPRKFASFLIPASQSLAVVILFAVAVVFVCLVVFALSRRLRVVSFSSSVRTVVYAFVSVTKELVGRFDGGSSPEQSAIDVV